MSQLGGLHGKGKGVRSLYAQRGRGGEGSRRPRGGRFPSVWCLVVRTTPAFQTVSWLVVGSNQGRAALHCWP